MVKVFTYRKEEMGSFPGCRTRYSYVQKNSKNENIIIELSHCEGSIMKMWALNGYIPKALENWINIDTYVIDSDGKCTGKYNPQIKRSTHAINFDWVLEDTPSNRIKILDKIVELANLDCAI